MGAGRRNRSRSPSLALFREVEALRRTSPRSSKRKACSTTGRVSSLLSLVLSFVGGLPPSVGALGGRFVVVAGGGIALGFVIGQGIAHVIRRIDDPMIEIALTMIAAYGSFALAEHLTVSGVVATVVAGMCCARHARDSGMSERSRAAAESFWEYVGFALNSIVFLPHRL